MGYVTQKFEKEKIVLSIFYGIITSEDLYNHVYAMNKKHDLSEEYCCVTDFTNVTENKSINIKTIMLMIKIRTAIRKPIEARGVLITDNVRGKVLANQFFKRADFNEGKMLIMSNLDEALSHLGRENLRSLLKAKIDKYSCST